MCSSDLTNGFFLSGNNYDVGVFALFLFQMVFMDTAGTLPTGAMAERWKFSAFIVFGFFMSMVVYPLFGNWVWGGGWLATLGSSFGLGHGHVDFAGSSVVHLVGGVAALGTYFLVLRLLHPHDLADLTDVLRRQPQTPASSIEAPTTGVEDRKERA